MGLKLWHILGVNMTSLPRQLSIKEVEIIYMESFFSITNSIHRCENAHMTDLCDRYYSDYKFKWFNQILAFRDYLNRIATNFGAGNIENAYYDPTHPNGHTGLKSCITAKESFSSFANLIELLYKNYNLAVYYPSQKDDEYLNNFFKKQKTSFVRLMTNLSPYEVEKICNLVDEIIDKEEKIKVLNHEIGSRNMPSDKKERYTAYRQKLIDENKVIEQKIMVMLPTIKNTNENAWLDEI